MNQKTILGVKFKKLKNWIGYWILVGGSAFLLIFLITSTWIGVSVKQQCKLAQAQYGGDCTESLLNVFKDEANTLRERNMSVWALGQLGDKRALPVLEKCYTGEIPNREPYDETLSQYELKKAMELLKGGFNLAAFIWRYDLPK